MKIAMFAGLIAANLWAQQAPLKTVQGRTANGTVEGVISADNQVRTFKGIPFAAPPVGPLRWREPQPVAAWTGIRKAVDFGPRCMQAPIYSDMIFHDAGPSEDCLYLNLWMPESAYQGKAPEDVKLPVMVWIGGGFQAGASSEPRQDGGNLSKKGVLVVSMNYRLGIFGFFSHPGLSKESGHDASGNYGLMDQLAALRWVHDNIRRFGGDPGNVTIFGESAGSFSVSALMASPLAKGLFSRAIGESGAYFYSSGLPMKTRAETEADDVKFAAGTLGAASLDELRAMPAAKLLEAASKQQGIRFAGNVDGYFLPARVDEIFAAGKQSQVPLLAGWNADEGNQRTLLAGDKPTPDNFSARARARFGERADQFLKVYPSSTDEEAKRSAQDFGGDQFIAYSTWKWIETQNRTGKSPVYRYEFDQGLPLPTPAAPHASEIEFVFQVLDARSMQWRPDDRKVSALMGSYWTNFAKTGDPNGPGLPKWPVYRADDGYQVMHFQAESQASPDTRRARYEFLDGVWGK